MIKTFLDYYLFDYEIGVYPAYTYLSKQMIQDKMNHFSQVLFDTDAQKKIQAIIACFFEKDDVEKWCISFLRGDAMKSTRPEVTPFNDNVQIKNYLTGDWPILAMPYYLFLTPKATKLKAKIDKGEIDTLGAYNEYKDGTNGIDFIWRKPFSQPINIEEARKLLKKESQLLGDQDGALKAYQKLYCLIVFSEGTKISIKHEEKYTDAFALTIKEWGLDILRQEIIKHSTRAAVTAIMARNISHNIGSHVITYWNAHLKDILFPNADWNNTDYLIDETHDYGTHMLKHGYPNAIYQSRNLFQYVQQRMDFIADISTSTPSSELSMNFKYDIMQVLTGNDGCEPKHGNLEPLLKHIAKSESYEEIIINTKECPGDAYVSIPNSVVGCHAIYSILENFIRNAAKHYKGSHKENILTIQIMLQEPKDIKLRKKYYEMLIYDTRKGSCSREILDNIKKYLPAKDKKKEFKFVDGNGVTPGGWGFKEMIASANFLRKNPTDTLLDIWGIDPPLIDLRCSDESCVINACNQDSFMCMKIYLMKPKDMLVLSGNRIQKDKFNIETPEDLGIDTANDDIAAIEVPHRIMLVDDDHNSNFTFPSLPCRTMRSNEVLNDNEFLKIYKSFITSKLLRVDNLELKLNARNFGKTVFLQTEEKEYIAAEHTENINSILFYYHLKDESRHQIETILAANYYYVQPVSASYSCFARITNSPEDPIFLENYYLELIESAVTKVLILDERVSELQKQVFKEDKGLKIFVKEIFQKMNIFAVDIKLDDLKIETVEQGINELGKTDFHFVVIHQGVLEKLGTDADGLLKNSAISGAKWKVVDSGRGVPPGLMREARFLEISTLLKFLNEYDKHGLVQNLFASRHPKNGGDQNATPAAI